MGIEDKKLQSKDPYSEWHKMLNEPVLYTKRPERVKFGSIEGRIVCLANIVFVAGRFVIEESTLLAKAGWNFIVSSGLEDGELKTQMREDVWYDLTVACVKVPTNISYLFQLTLGVLSPSAAIAPKPPEADLMRRHVQTNLNAKRPSPELQEVHIKVE